MKRIVMERVRFSTDRFAELNHRNCDILANRILSLPFVCEVDPLYGFIEIELSGELTIGECMEILELNLAPRIARGEKVVEQWHESGPYTYHYSPGEYQFRGHSGMH